MCPLACRLDSWHVLTGKYNQTLLLYRVLNTASFLNHSYNHPCEIPHVQWNKCTRTSKWNYPTVGLNFKQPALRIVRLPCPFASFISVVHKVLLLPARLRGAVMLSKMTEVWVGTLVFIRCKLLRFLWKCLFFYDVASCSLVEVYLRFGSPSSPW